MNVRPVLDDWEIPRIAAIRTRERRRFAEFAVPGRVGSLYQDLNSAPTVIEIHGSLYGTEARNEFLEEVRSRYKAGEPLTFVADVITATEVQYVLIEALGIDESGERPDQYEYTLVLRESPPPPPPDVLGGIDAGLLDQAGGFLDTVTGALDVIEALGNVPDFGDPTPPLQGALGEVGSALEGLGGVRDSLNALFGNGG